MGTPCQQQFGGNFVKPVGGRSTRGSMLAATLLAATCSSTPKAAGNEAAVCTQHHATNCPEIIERLSPRSAT